MPQMILTLIFFLLLFVMRVPPIAIIGIAFVYLIVQLLIGLAGPSRGDEIAQQEREARTAEEQDRLAEVSREFRGGLFQAFKDWVERVREYQNLLDQGLKADADDVAGEANEKYEYMRHEFQRVIELAYPAVPVDVREELDAVDPRVDPNTPIEHQISETREAILDAAFPLRRVAPKLDHFNRERELIWAHKDPRDPDFFAFYRQWALKRLVRPFQRADELADEIRATPPYPNTAYKFRNRQEWRNQFAKIRENMYCFAQSLEVHTDGAYPNPLAGDDDWWQRLTENRNVEIEQEDLRIALMRVLDCTHAVDPQFHERRRLSFALINDNRRKWARGGRVLSEKNCDYLVRKFTREVSRPLQEGWQVLDRRKQWQEARERIEIGIHDFAIQLLEDSRGLLRRPFGEHEPLTDPQAQPVEQYQQLQRAAADIAERARAIDSGFTPIAQDQTLLLEEAPR